MTMPIATEVRAHLSDAGTQLTGGGGREAPSLDADRTAHCVRGTWRATIDAPPGPRHATQPHHSCLPSQITSVFDSVSPSILVRTAVAFAARLAATSRHSSAASPCPTHQLSSQQGLARPPPPRLARPPHTHPHTHSCRTPRLTPTHTDSCLHAQYQILRSSDPQISLLRSSDPQIGERAATNEPSRALKPHSHQESGSQGAIKTSSRALLAVTAQWRLDDALEEARGDAHAGALGESHGGAAARKADGTSQPIPTASAARTPARTPTSATCATWLGSG